MYYIKEMLGHVPGKMILQLWKDNTLISEKSVRITELESEREALEKKAERWQSCPMNKGE